MVAEDRGKVKKEASCRERVQARSECERSLSRERKSFLRRRTQGTADLCNMFGAETSGSRPFASEGYALATP